MNQKIIDIDEVEFYSKLNRDNFSGIFIIKWYNSDHEFEIDHVENGRLHKLDGPAVKYWDGVNHFYINGEFYEECDYWNKIYMITNKLEDYD